MRLIPVVTLLLFLLFAGCPDDQALKLDPPRLAAPSNGSTISQNPPTFMWHGSDEEQIVYLLEIAVDSFFTSSTVIYYGGPITPPDSQYTLTDSLTAGTYYWHACVMQDC